MGGTVGIQREALCRTVHGIATDRGWRGGRLATAIGPSEAEANLVKTFVAGVVILVVTGTANADFSNVFAPANWTLNNPAQGDAALDALLMHLKSGNVGVSGVTEYSIPITADDTLSFDWDFHAYDSPGEDWCYYSLNGVRAVLADASGDPGSAVVPVSMGDVFALGVETSDGQYNYGEFSVTEFSFTIPEPSTLGMLLLGTLVLGAARLRRQ